MELERKKKIVKFLIENNILVDSSIVLKIENESTAKQIEALSAMHKNRETVEQEIRKALELETGKENEKYNVKILRSHQENFKKKSIQDFITYFNNRHKKLSSFLQKKQELQDATSIKRILSKTEKEQVSFIGLIYETSKTKNNNIMLTVEDPTGQIKAIVHNSKPDLVSISEDLVHDECIGVVGTFSKGIVFVNSIILPDIPPTKELKKAPEEQYAVFAGDTHIGSKQFLEEEFSKLIKWFAGEAGSEEQRAVAKKTKYFFIVGDLVDGLGVYPTQFNDLNIRDWKQQYQKLAEGLKKIPKEVAIILCPGNHDAIRLSEPQPPVSREFCQELYEMPNVFMVSSPSSINIASTENFSGFDILIYHGTSFHYYSEKVKSISAAGGQTRADMIMKFLLQRRHLAPAHTSTQYMPETDEDPLVIDKIPDFFVTGHIHRATIASYRNVACFNCSCWIGMTEYQEKVGLVPEPSRVIVANLQTREAKIMRF